MSQQHPSMSHRRGSGGLPPGGSRAASGPALDKVIITPFLPSQSLACVDGMKSIACCPSVAAAVPYGRVLCHREAAVVLDVLGYVRGT